MLAELFYSGHLKSGHVTNQNALFYLIRAVLGVFYSSQSVLVSLLLQAEQALFSVSCDRRSVDTVWRCNAETSDWIQWRENGVSLETFSVLYTEAKYRTLVAAGSHSHGVFSTTAQYVRAGIQQLSGEVQHS